MSPHQKFVDHLAAGTLDADDASHALGCPACAALLPDGVPDVDGLRSSWLEAAHRELARPVRPWWALAAGLAGANALLAAAAVATLEPWNWDGSRSGHGRLLGATALLAALVTVGALLALAPRQRWLRGVLGLAALAPVGVLLTTGGVATHPFLAGAHCLWTAVSLSAVPLAGGLFLLTRVAYSPLRALVVGLTCAGVGLLVLQLHCDGTQVHVLAFHLLPWVALGAATVLVRRRLPTSSYAP